ncbi:hypothetical protein GCM10025734_16370 [Kitasatospora paranensis]
MDDRARRLDRHPLDQPESLRRDVVDRRDMLDAGVVDHDVGVLRQAVRGDRVGQVHHHRRPAALLGARIRRLGGALHDVDPGPAPANPSAPARPRHGPVAHTARGTL